MIRLSQFLRLSIGCVVVLLFCAISTGDVHASNGAYGDGTYGSCTYGTCSITLTSSGTVSINVTPTASALCSIQNDAVGVFTDASTGYTLTLNDSDTNNSMSSGSSSVPAVTGTQASPAALSADKWGYRVDGVGGFGSGPTSGSTNAAPSSTTFALVPLSTSSGDTLATSSSAADPTVTTKVWYGICADLHVPAGTYSDQVTYTAVVN